MSYKLTEAERKHVAAVEDTKVFLTADHVEGRTPSIKLHITDEDKLNHEVELPSYAFYCDKNDDAVSKIRIKDEVNGEEIECKGYDGKGIGWRYRITFLKKEDTDYVESIKLICENDATKSVTMTFNKMAALTLEGLTVDGGSTFKSNAVFEKSVNVGENLNVTGDVTAENARIEKDLTANAITSKDTQTDMLHTKSASFKNTGDELGTVEFKNEHIIIDESNDVEITKAKINEVEASKVNSNEVEVNSLKSTSAEVGSLNVTGGSTLSGPVTGNQAKFLDGDFNTLHSKIATADQASIDNLVVSKNILTDEESTAEFKGETKLLGKTRVADEYVQESEVAHASVGNADIDNETVKLSTIEDLTVEDETVENLKLTGAMTTADGKNIFKVNGNTDVELGDGDKRLVIKSAGIGEIDDENHYHIEAEIDGKSTMLLTTEDASKFGLDNVVDKTSNQQINGIKQFNNTLFANDAIVAKHRDYSHGYSEENRNIVYRGPDLNDKSTTSYWLDNPAYAEAQAEKEAYDESSQKYSDAVIAANAMNNAFRIAKRAENNVKDTILENIKNDAYNKFISSGDEIDIDTSKIDKDPAATANTASSLNTKARALKQILASNIGLSYNTYKVYPLQTAIDAYNTTQAEENRIALTRGDNLVFDGYETNVAVISDETFATIDSVYDVAVNSAAIDVSAQNYLQRIYDVLTKENIESVVDAINRKIEEFPILKAFMRDDYGQIKDVTSFFSYCDSLNSGNNAAMRVIDTYVAAITADPSLKGAALYENQEKHEDGVYSTLEPGVYNVVTTVSVPLLGEVPVTLTGVEYSYNSADESRITQYSEKGLTSKIINNYSHLSNSYKNALKCLTGNIPAAIANLKKISDSSRVIDDLSNEDVRLAITGLDFDAVVEELYDSLPSSFKNVVAKTDVMTAVENAIDDVKTNFGMVSSGDADKIVLTSLLHTCSEVDALISRTTLTTPKEAVSDLSSAENLYNTYLSTVDTLNTAIANFNTKSAVYAEDEYMKSANESSGTIYRHEDKTSEDLTFDTRNIYAPERTVTVELFRTGNIVEKYINPEVNTVLNFGNPVDELSFMGAANSDGDEHILATIGGHLHQVAYLDDFKDSHLENLDGVAKSIKVIEEDETHNVSVVTDKELKTVYTSAEIAKGAYGVSEKEGGTHLIDFVAGDGIEIKNERGKVKISADKFDVTDNGDGSISLGSAAGKTSFTSSHDDLTFEKDDDGNVDVNLTNIFTGDKFRNDEILSDYESLTATEKNNKALAKALDVKAVRDELKTVAINTQTSLDTRVPSAPRHTGSYMLNAVVLASEPDENGNIEMTSKYAWNGAIMLPDTSEDARDDSGNPLVTSPDAGDDIVEYGLKMHIVLQRIKYADGSVKEERVPILTWSRLN